MNTKLVYIGTFDNLEQISGLQIRSVIIFL